MSFDITPAVPRGHQLIRKYGAGRFTIGEAVHEGSVLVFAEYTEPWPIGEPAGITAESLVTITDIDAAIRPQILIVGCGACFTVPPTGLRQSLKQNGVVLEWMDTGAACRTFNVLLAEGRSAAAALIAVD